MTEKAKNPVTPPANTQPQTLAQRSESAMENALRKITQLQQLGQLEIPENYSPENAVRAAWLEIQELEDKNGKKVLEVCKPTTVAQSLLKMVTLGLSYVKGQCYFIPYGDELVCDPSYIGDVAIAKREIGLVDINAVVVYEGDEFEYEVNPDTGIRRVLKHVQKLEDIIDGKEKGVYAVAQYADGKIKTEVMPMSQVRAAWAQGSAKGDSPAHRKFPGEMAKKTCIYRLLKVDKGSADDSHLGIKRDKVVADVSHQIQENGHRETIKFEEIPDAQTSDAPEPDRAIQPETQENSNEPKF